MDSHRQEAASTNPPASGDKMMFWACFIALIATAFGFVVRTQIIEEWGKEFSLSKTQQGEIFGVGLWPFAISIVLFSLFIDRIGYGKTMFFAFFCHILSAVITIFTKPIADATGIKPYWVLYIGTFIVALGNGTVEAVINPVIATMFSNQKTKWLNMLHAGWPGGLVLGGVIALAMGNMNWQYKVALIFLPVVAYGVLMIGRTFPVNERVAAGVSYMEMLQQVGLFGALIVGYLIVSEVGRVFGIPQIYQYILIGLIALGFGGYTRSLGHPLFVFLLLIMVPLATTELGTDSWIGDLMGPEMAGLGLKGGWVLIYTSAIMLILRFFAGPIVHKISPLGLLAVSALIAAGGLYFLSQATGIAILLAATLYGFGKTFFWPTMLGVVAEQFPKGGALTLNTCGGVGMLAVGVIGTSFLGYNQDSRIDSQLKQENAALHARVVSQPKVSVFGTYQPLDQDKVDALSAEDQKVIKTIDLASRKNALKTVALLPCIMFVCYSALIAYFQMQGGYKPKVLLTAKEEGEIMRGGLPAAVEL